MPALPTRELKIGQIIDRTLGVLERSAVPALIFVLALAAASGAITYVSAGSTAILEVAGGQLLKSLVGIVCGYFLLVAMMRRAGLHSQTEEDAFLPYIGMSILASLAVMMGMIALILPGLFLMVRWSIAQPLIVARGGGVMASLGESWERTRGNEFSIFAAALALAVLPVAVLIATSIMFEQGDLVGIAISELVGGAISLIFLAMGVALYGLIAGPERAAATFG